MNNIEKIRQEIERQLEYFKDKEDDAWDDCNNYADEDAFWYQGHWKMCSKLLAFIDSLQPEQSEVDLGKFTEKIKTFQGRYKYPEILSIKGAMGFMARMFYQYPNTARQWYDSLPKATMD